MSYLLRMSAEIRDWLAGLRLTDPQAALRAGQALAALIEAGPDLGPPCVVPLADPAPPEDPREALDAAYQDRLDRMQSLRRGVADASSLASYLQARIADLERQQEADPAGPASGQAAQAAAAEAAELRRLLPGISAAAGELTERQHCAAARLDDFRVRKEVLKARYTAAEATMAVGDILASGGEERVGDADLLREVSADIERELGAGSRAALMELRPGDPAASEVRIIFAVEPPGTALLIAVVEGREAILDRRAEAADVAAAVLGQVRAGQDPQAAACGFDDVESFAAEFFPGLAGELAAGVAALLGADRGRTLADQRERLGLSQEQVAARMGVRQERVAAIEHAGPGAAEVRTLASYTEALGGRLEVVADFPGERVVLR